MTDPVRRRRPPDPKTVRTLILKGGGVKGLAFAGAIDELIEAGYSFRTFVGTSAGSVAAVLLAAGYTPRQIEGILKKTDFREFLDAAWWVIPLNVIAYGGMYPGRKLRDWLEQHLRGHFPTAAFPSIDMKSLRARGSRAVVFASHPRLGTLVFDSHGANQDAEISYAVRLSSSIPFFFVPGSHNGHRIYDGGLLNNFPVEAYAQIRQDEIARSGQDDDKPDSDAAEASDLVSDDPADLQEKDFIALYLGKTSELPRRSFWLWEVLNITLARDDSIQLSRNLSRSIIIDVDPIGTTDFDISEAEKRYLVQKGRLAAKEFLNDPEAPALRDEVSRLRAEIEQERASRRMRSTVKFLAAAAVLVGSLALLWQRTSDVAPFVTDSKVVHARTYIDHQSVVGPLSQGAIDDLVKTHQNYVGYQKGALLFDSAVQVVYFSGPSAFKIVCYEGEADKGFIKINASNVSGGGELKANGYLFEKRDGEWRPIDCPWAERADGSESSGKVMKELWVPNHFKAGTRLRVVTMARYDDAYPVADAPRVAAWTLLSHRLLKPGGECAYLLVADERNGTNIDHVVPHRVYLKTTPGRFRLLDRPHMNEAIAWSRAMRVVDFLGRFADRKEDADKPDAKRDTVPMDDLWERFESVAEGVRGGYERWADKSDSPAFAFTFDAADLDPADRVFSGETNLLVFVREPLQKKESPRTEHGEPARATRDD